MDVVLVERKIDVQPTWITHLVHRLAVSVWWYSEVHIMAGMRIYWIATGRR